MTRSARALSVFLIATSAHASSQQTVVRDVLGNGTCSQEYVLVVDVCVARSALETRTKHEIVQLIFEHNEMSTAGGTKNGGDSDSKLCVSKVSDDNDDFFELRDGSFLKKTSYGYVGYIGYAKNTLLVLKSRSTGILMIENKDPFKVEVIRPAGSCATPSTYRIQTAYNDEKFVINGELFESQTYCLGWGVGESIYFLEGSEYGSCSSAKLYNVEREETCSVWCE